MVLECENCGKEFNSVRSARRFCCKACANTASARVRTEQFDNEAASTVWSCGGGIQSTAIAVLICEGRLPKPDFAFMADCGFESRRTYDYIERVIRPKLAEVGVEFNLVRSDKYVKTEIMDANGRCNIPAFRKNEDGTVSHLSTRCNGTWKQRVMATWLRERGVTKCVDWVGISTDEARRSRESVGVRWIKPAYPLIELGMSRRDCVDTIKQAGWEMPLRTSCIMCPQRTLFEWARLKMDCPEDFETACLIEESIQQIDPNVFLTAKCRPLREVIEGE